MFVSTVAEMVRAATPATVRMATSLTSFLEDVMPILDAHISTSESDSDLTKAIVAEENTKKARELRGELREVLFDEESKDVSLLRQLLELRRKYVDYLTVHGRMRAVSPCVSEKQYLDACLCYDHYILQVMVNDHETLQMLSLLAFHKPESFTRLMETSDFARVAAAQSPLHEIHAVLSERVLVEHNVVLGPFLEGVNGPPSVVYSVISTWKGKPDKLAEIPSDVRHEILSNAFSFTLCAFAYADAMWRFENGKIIVASQLEKITLIERRIVQLGGSVSRKKVLENKYEFFLQAGYRKAKRQPIAPEDDAHDIREVKEVALEDEDAVLVEMRALALRKHNAATKKQKKKAFPRKKGRASK